MSLAAQVTSHRYKARATLVTGAPILLVSGPEPVMADSILIVMEASAAGAPGQVYDDVQPALTPVDAALRPAQIAAGMDLPVPLAAAPADAVNPGGSYSYTGSFDLRTYAVGGTTGNTMLIDAHLKI